LQQNSLQSTEGGATAVFGKATAAGAALKVARTSGRGNVHRLLAALAIIGALTGSTVAPTAAQHLAQASPPPSPQIWPSKPMRIVVPWPPGGSADMIGRILAEHLGNAFAQSIVVENRPGASGMVGSAAVARSDPDGTTFVISGIPSHVVAPATSATAPFTR
jgi:hypothetical protein